MSGHSKWHSIRRSKGILDNKRGALFTKLAREIMVAAREGGSGDVNANFRLRMAVEKARTENMPSDNIKRAIDKAMGTGGEGAAQFEEIVYEGYGPSGVAILVSSLTDNRNRTASEVRSAFGKGGGNLGETGSVAWMFEMYGLIRLEINGHDAEEMVFNAIDAGAADVQIQEEEVEVYTAFEDLKKVQDVLEALKYRILSAEKTYVAKTPMELTEASKALQALKMIERLEDLDDVQNVYSNLEIPDEVAATMGE